MKVIDGDLVELAQLGHFDVIVHGCNCFCTMGAGIAEQIKGAFPDAYWVDQNTQKGDINKLGTYSVATVRLGESVLHIVNAYTQFDWRGGGVKVSYDAVRRVFSQIKSDLSGKRIGYPAIGAGLAGGDWGKISAIIDEVLFDEDHTLVTFRR